MEMTYPLLEGMNVYINNSCRLAKPLSKFEFYVIKQGKAFASKQEDRHLPGYITQHTDGVIEWTPKELFESTCTINGALTFGLAMVAMQLGWKIKRPHWTDYRCIWITNYNEPHKTPKILVNSMVSILDHIWWPSQSDMFAVDWEVIPKDKG